VIKSLIIDDVRIDTLTNRIKNSEIRLMVTFDELLINDNSVKEEIIRFLLKELHDIDSQELRKMFPDKFV